MNTTFMPESLAGMPGIHANSGGPMSRTRKERIWSSLLGSKSGVVRCPLRISLYLSFNSDEEHMEDDLMRVLAEANGEDYCSKLPPELDLEPMEYLESLLRAEGLSDPEELRERYTIPQNKLICGPWVNSESPLFVHSATAHDVLKQALMLGLCTDQMYDPTRPVLWTETSIYRAVVLYEPGSFYA